MEQRILLSADPLGGEARINSCVTGDQVGVAVDSDASGNYVAVWRGANVQGWSGTDIYFQRYSRRGTPLGPETRANQDWEGSQTNPDVAVADDGGFVVSWTTDDDGDDNGVEARRFDADGTPLSGDFQVNSYTTGAQQDAEVAVRGDTGEFVIVWESDGQDGSDWGVYGQRYAADGTAAGGEFQINTHTGYSQHSPAVAMDAAGNFTAAWTSDRNQDGDDEGIFSQRFAADGTALGGEYQVNTYTSNDQSQAAMGMAEGGDYVIAWRSYNQDGDGDGVYAQRYAADGTAQGDEFAVNTHTSSHQDDPAVAVDALGDFIITWESYNQDGQYDGVFAQKYNSDGTASGGEFQVNTHTDHYQGNPAIVHGAGGDFLIAWQSRNQDGSGWGVYSQLYGTPSGVIDLVPVKVAGPSGANVGQTIDVESELRNQGSAAAGAFACQYYLSDDPVITAADTALGSPIAVSGLGPFETFADSRAVQIPADVPAGDYYVGLLVDADGEVAEGDETNNGTATSALPAISIEPPPSTLGGEARINSSVTGDQTGVAVDSDASGNYVAVWGGASVQGWSGTDIYFQRYSRRGTPLGPETRANEFWEGSQANPDVAVADDGSFVVSWTTDDDGDDNGVEARRFDADGTPLAGDFQVNTHTTGAQEDAEVAVRGDTGEFVIVWESDGQDGSGWGVYGQRYAADGTAAGSEFQINTYTANSQQSPAVAMEVAGNFTVAWTSDGNQDGDDEGIFSQRFAADGTALGGEYQVNTYTSNDQAQPAMGMAEGGDYVIAWTSEHQDGDRNGVYAQRYAADGTAQGDEFAVNTYTSSNQDTPAVAVDALGDFIITWESYNQDGSYDGVFAQKYESDGTASGGEFQVNTHTGQYQSNPAIIHGAGGDFFIAWQSRYQDGSGWGVYSQLYGAESGVIDLVPVKVAGPSGANVGQTIELESEVRNQGSAAAGAFACQYYLSTDEVITAADTALGGRFTISELGPYETHTDSRQVQVPFDAPTGQFYVGLVVDIDGDVAEEDETNNGTATSGFSSVNVQPPPSPLGGEFRVNSSTGGDQRWVSMDSDAAGNYVVVWQGANTGGAGTDDIYLQLYNAEGTPLGPERQVNSDWHGEQTSPDVAVADDGTFMVTWSDDADEDGNFEIMARRFAADGSPLSDAFTVNTYTTKNQTDPEIAVNKNTGEFVIVWTSEGQDTSGDGVFGQRFSADGTPLGNEFQVNTHIDDNQNNPAVAMMPSGNFVVAWQSYQQDASRSQGIYAQRFADDGSRLGSEFLVNRRTADDQFGPAVAADADGNFVVVFSSEDQDGSSNGVYGQRYAADGASVGDEFRVNTYTADSQADPDVVMFPGGEFVVAWNSEQDGSREGVYAQRYRADGAPVGGEFRVNTHTGYSQWAPSVAAGVGQDFLVGWQSQYQDGDGYGIYAQLYGEEPAKPDLIPVSVEVPGGANLQQTIEVGSTIRNQGGVAAGSFVAQYYLSTDDVIDTGDTPLGDSFTVDGLEAHATHVDTRTFALQDVAPGDWYVGLIVDTTEAVNEANEANNAYQPWFDEPAMNVAALPMLALEQQANTTTSDDQSEPSVGIDAAGNYIAVWHSRNQDGSGFGIYGQRFSASGSPLGGEFQINSTTSGDQKSPTVAVAADGRFVVAWQSDDQDGSDWGVYAQRFAADGSPVGSEFQVNTYTNSDQDSPAAAVDGGGNFIIVWHSAGQDAGNNGGIYAQRYSADGTPDGPEFWVSSDAGPNQQRPAVAANDSGEFIVGWDDSYTVYARRFQADGTALGDEFVANTYAPDQQQIPSVGIDDSGNSIVVWESDYQDGDREGIFAQRYAADGSPLGNEFRVNTRTIHGQGGPAVAVAGAGDFVVTWHSDNQDGSSWGIFAQRYAADGTPLGGEFRINQETSGNQHWPVVAALDADHFVTAWQSSGQDGSDWGVYTLLAGVSDERNSPNLVMSELSVPWHVELDETVEVSMTIQNTGMTVAPSTTARLYLSDDDVAGNGDDLETGIEISVPQILSDGWNNTYQTTVGYTWPAADPFGTDRDYYFVAVVDPDSTVEETSEADNSRVSNSVRLRMPDLTGWMSADPSSIVPGEEITLDMSIKNRGDATAAASLGHLWLSDDNTLGNEDDIDLFIDITVPSLEVYAVHETSVSYTWPEPDPFDTDGQYYVLLELDPAGDLIELNEDNNVVTTGISVNRPNLVVHSVSVPDEVDPGASITVDLEVRNTGTAAADPSTLHLWLSDDSVGGNGDDHDLLIDVTVPTLEPYSWPDYTSFSSSVELTWPEVDPFGTDLRYFVVAETDAAGVIEEGNEEDNYGVSGPIRVRMPDLKAARLRTASTVQPGRELEAYLDVWNAGAKTAPASTARVWLSDNDVFGDADDVNLTPPLDLEVPELAQGDSWSPDLAVPWPEVDPFGTDGEYYLAVELDSLGEIKEGNETNNVIVSGPLAVVTPFDLDINLAGHLGGSSQAAAVAGDYAYELTTAGLRVLDISDPSGIVKLTEIVFPVSSVGDVQVAGDRLYTADSAAVRIFDISARHAPSLLAEHAVEPFSYTAATFQGDVLFAADALNSQLDIIDLSDPGGISVLAEYDTRGVAMGIAVEDGTAYLSYDDTLFEKSAIEVVDVSNLADPTFVSRRALRSSSASPYQGAGQIAVAGNTAAMMTWDGDALVLLDVADAALPRVLSTYSSSYGIAAIHISGNTLHVATQPDWQEGHPYLAVLDISGPADPAEIGMVSLAVGEPGMVATAGSKTYVAGGTFSVVDVADRFNPAVLGTYYEPSDFDNIVLAGSIACVTSGKRLELIDVSQPAVPHLLGTYTAQESIDRLIASGSHVLLAQGMRSYNQGQLELVDISDPDNPVFVATHPLEDLGYLMDFAIDGDQLYLLGAESNWDLDAGQLSVVDISDVLDPAPVSITDLFLQAREEWNSQTQQYEYSLPELAVHDGKLLISNTFPLDQEENDTRQTAIDLGSLSTPAVVHGVANDPDDGGPDYYRFSGTQGDMVTIDLRGAREDVGNFHKGNVYLYDSEGSHLDSDYYYRYDPDDMGTIEGYSLPYTGEYYIRVYGYSDDTYGLAVALNEPVPPPRPFVGIRAYDVSDPASPVHLGTANPGRLMGGMVYDGSEAYVTMAEPDVLEIWDFSDPANPLAQGSARVEQAGELIVSGTLASVSSGSRIQVVDVNDPERPVALESYETGGNVNGFAVEGSVTFVASDSLYNLVVQPEGVETPDLAVNQITLPSAVQLGSPMDIGWTVRNHGQSAAAGTWTDAVYLSADAILDPEVDTRLGERTHTGPLNSLQTYSENLRPTIVGVTPGEYYVIVRADDLEDVDEGFVESNNVRVSSRPVYIGHPDLDVTNIDVPAASALGDVLPVEWNVFNRDFAPAAGDWTDSAYLSLDTTLDIGTDHHVGTRSHGGGLDPQIAYQAALDVDTAAIPEGTYYVIVVSDSEEDLFEDGREANNLEVSKNPVRLGIPELTLDTPQADTFEFAEQSKYYQVAVDAGEHLFVFLDDLNDTGSNELYIKYGSAPSRGDYDARYSTNLAADQHVEIPATQAGSYYILAYAESVPDAPGEFEITASILDFEILGISPVQAGNAGEVTMSIRVAKLPVNATPVLVAPDGTRYLPSSVYQDSPEVFYPTFNLDGAELGSYDVRVEVAGGGEFITTPDLFQVHEGQGGDLQADLSVPTAARATRPFSTQISYRNKGDADIPAPMFLLTATGGVELVYRNHDPVPAGSSLHLVGISPTGPAGILRPGTSGRLVIDSVAVAGDMRFSLTTLVDDDTPVNWNAFKEDARREWISSEDWDALWPTIVAGIGNTWGDYLEMLGSNATRRGMQGLRTASVQELFGMEICRALDIGGVSVISGVVVDATSGQPVVNASLSARQEIGANTSVLRAAETNSDGKFLLNRLPPGAYELQVDGYYFDEPPIFTLTDNTDSLNVVLSASRVAAVSGTVKTVGEELPVADATVTAIGEDSGHFESSRTTETGEYEFGSLPADTYTLTIVANSYLRQEITGVSLAPGEVLAGTDFSLSEGATLAGVVQDAEDLTPISAATVIVVNSSGQSHSSTTDGSGQYLVPSLAPGDWVVRVNHPKYQPSEPATLTVTGQTGDVLDVELLLGGSITGIVTDASGTPIGGATVRAVTSDLIRTTTTASDGTYQFGGLAGGDYTLTVDVGGYAIRSRELPGVQQNSVLTEVDFQLESGCSVRGTVARTNGGTPIAGAEVLLQGNSGQTITTTTQVDGSYLIDTLAPDVYYLRSQADGYLAFQQMLNVPAESAPLSLDIMLDEGATVTGSVLADGATPIASALLVLKDAEGKRVASTMSDAIGAYELGPVPLASGYIIEATHAQYTFDLAALDLTTPTQFTLDLSPATGSISGVVTDLDSSGFVEGATVSAVIRGNSDSRAWPLQTETASDGSYSFGHLIDADYLVIVTADGFGRSISERTISSGEIVIEDVRLSSSHPVSGTVSDKGTMTPVADALVWIVDADYPQNDPGFVAFTDETGSYAFANVSAGEHLVYVTAESYSVDKSEINVSGTTAHDVRLSTRGHTLSGTVSDAASGYPLGGAIVSVAQDAYPPRSVITSSDGSFELRSLPTGEYDISVVFHEERTTQTISLNGSDNVTLAIALPPMAASSDFLTPLQNEIASNTPLASSTSATLRSYQLATTTTSSNRQSGLIPKVEKIRGFRPTPVPKQPIVPAPSSPKCDFVEVGGKTYFLSTAGFGYRRDNINELAYAADNTLTELERRTHNFLLDCDVLAFNVSIEGVLVAVPIDTYTYLNSDNPKEIVKAAVIDAVLMVFPLGTPISWAMNMDAFAERVSKRVEGLNAEADSILSMQEEYRDQISEMYAEIYEYDEGEYSGAQKVFMGLKQYERLNKLCDDDEDDDDPDPEEDQQEEEDEKNTEGVQSSDPNDKTGPAAVGEGQYLLPGSLMPYTVFYENNPEKATAPAMLVEVEDYLSPDLDWSTFELGDINLYADFWVDVPEGLQHWESTVDLRPEGKDLLVDILADFDSDSGLAYWAFQSLDPETLEEPLDPFAGFLSHRDENNANDGSVSYIVSAEQDLSTGTVIENFAVSTFDRFSSDTTPTVFNTIDAGAPAGSVAPLPAQVPDEPFTVSWTGEDDEGGSGIASYTVYVKMDDNDWQVWLEDTPETSAEFTGVGGHRYAFRAVAEDQVGLVEDGPGVEEAFTEVDFSQLRVDLLETTPSGFVAHFKRELDASLLNLYDVEAETFGPADFTVVGDTVGEVAGSMVYDAEAKTVRFVKTGEPLEPDTYTITLRSAENGFTDAEGHLLDGDEDDAEGGDYVATRTVEPSSARVLSLPDVARGPGQAVDVPATGSGIPLRLSDGEDVLSIDFTLHYDPAMLSVSGISLGDTLPSGWASAVNLNTPGQAVITIYGSTPLNTGPIVVGDIEAVVPDDAPYSSAAVLSISNSQLNEGAMLATGDSAVQVVSYFGDATGNYGYSGLDAAYIARVSVGLDNGFAAFRMKDPVIVADTTGNGSLGGLDAAYVARKSVGLEQPDIPDLPGVLPSILAGGPDPVVTVGTTTGSPGSDVVLPISVDDTDGLQSVDSLTIEYDTAYLDVSGTDVSLGDALSGWFAPTVNADDENGTIRITSFTLAPMAAGSGEMFNITFHIDEEAPDETMPVHITAGTLNEGGLVMTPVDGQIEVSTVNQWQHPHTPLDVNDDGRISPLDVLLIIAHLNKHGGGALPAPPKTPPPYLNVNGDNRISPVDALVIIAHLNSVYSGGAEAEGEAGTTTELASHGLGGSVAVDPQPSRAPTSSIAQTRDAALSRPESTGRNEDFLTLLTESDWENLSQANSRTWSDLESPGELLYTTELRLQTEMESLLEILAGDARRTGLG